MASKRRSHGQGTLFKRNGHGPWITSWYDHSGKRKERSARTTDKAAAERILNKRVADAALRRDGVIDARKDGFAVQGRKPLTGHIADYIAHCRHTGQAPRHVDQKETHLARLLDVTGVSRLGDLSADAMERYMRHLIDGGMSARTANFARQIAVAFASWCVKTARLESNPLKVVPKLDDQRDRRRVRRPLADDELARLLDVAGDRGRKAWYLAAALAGLRKGDLQRLRWCDIDFDANTITIAEGKAKRVDMIPMHPQLADELNRRRDEALAMPKAKVFPTTVTDVTRQKDFLRAGLVRETVVMGDDGKPVMIGMGKRKRPKTRIVCEDDEGRVIDLHAMRTTLGTNLARAGVAPQLCQRIMRHSDYKTTLKHYTVLGLTDTAKAIASLPGIDRPTNNVAKATGTTDAMPLGDPQQYPQQKPQQLGREAVQGGAATCDGGSTHGRYRGERKPCGVANPRDTARRDATIRDQPAGVTQLVECQPSKLNVAGSTPVARFLSNKHLRRSQRILSHPRFANILQNTWSLDVTDASLINFESATHGPPR